VANQRLDRLRREQGAISLTPGSQSLAPQVVGRDKIEALPRTNLLIRAGAVLVAIGLAYHYSLATLAKGLALDSPLAYLGLVPVGAILLAFALAAQWRSEPDIHDRHVDYIIGLPLVAGALAIVVLLPMIMSTFFWLLRLDLLALPLFAAGTVTIVFGARACWRIKMAIAYLLLAWPISYERLLPAFLAATTDATNLALRAATSVLPIATWSRASDGSVFSIWHAGHSFELSVGSACSGANGVAGFLLVGVALTAVFEGSAASKLAWLVAGAVTTWMCNLARILIVFWAGGLWGEGIALEAIHPLIGLLVFDLGVVVMLVALPLFRLRLPFRFRSKGRLLPSAPAVRLWSRRAVPRARFAIGLVLLAATVAAAADQGLTKFRLVSDELGTSRVTALSEANASLNGWTLEKVNSYAWARQYFGEQGTWDRFAYRRQTTAVRPSGGSSVVVMDVIGTGDLATFSTYGVEACYRYHNSEVLQTGRVDLGGGAVGQSALSRSPDDQGIWLMVYWEWPVRVGPGDRYERVVLNIRAPEGAGGPGARSTPNGAAGSVLDLISDFRYKPVLPGGLQEVRSFLIEFARQVVAATVKESVN
jgi:exosortase/archaeosortase family protein